MNVDDALSEFGGGRFRRQLLAVCLHLNVLFGNNLHLMSVIAPDVEIPTGIHGANHTTLSTHFTLSESQSSLIAGVYAAGLAVGAVASGQLADIYGRKPILITNFVLMTIALLISAFASSWQVFAGERFFTGIFQGGAMVTNFLLVYELTESAYAGIVAIFCVVFQALGMFLVAFFGFILPTWKLVIIAVSTSGSIYPFILYFLVPESCRWVYAIGNTERAEEVISTIAKRNKKDNYDVRLARDIGRDEITGVKTLSSILGLPKLRNRLVLGFCLWFFSTAVYFGANISAPGLDVGVYWRLSLLSLLHIPVYFTVMFQMYNEIFGRKGTLRFYLCFATLALGVAVATSKANLPVEVTTLIEIMGKAGGIGAYSLLYLYTAEMFPNQVRGVALGLTIMAGSSGAIAAHYINKLVSTASFLPNAVWGVMGLIACVLTCFVPATLDRSFPSMITFSTSYRRVGSDGDEHSINDGD